MSQELLTEKCFDEEQELIMEFIKLQLERHGWETLFAPPQRIYEKLVKEFYAVMHSHRGHFVRIRGKLVSFSPTTINAHLGLPDTFNAIGNDLIVHPSNEQVEEARRFVCRLKKLWIVSPTGILSLKPLDLN